MKPETRTTQHVPIKEIKNRLKKSDLDMTADKWKLFVADVKARGLDQPVKLIKAKDGYLIEHGQHRVAAHAELKQPTVEAFVANNAKAIDPVNLLMENVARKDLSPLQLGRDLARCLDQDGVTQATLAKTTGISQAKISKHAALVKLPACIGELVGTHVHIDSASYLQPLADHDELAKRVAKELRDGNPTTLWRAVLAAASENPAIGCEPLNGWGFVRECLGGKYDWQMPERIAEDALYKKGIQALPHITFGTKKDGEHHLCLEPEKAREAVTAAARRIHETLQKQSKKEGKTADGKQKTLTPSQVTPKAIQVDDRLATRYLATGKDRTVQLIQDHLPKQRTLPDDLELEAYIEVADARHGFFRSKKDRDAWEAIVHSILGDTAHAKEHRHDMDKLLRHVWDNGGKAMGRHEVRKLLAALRAYGSVVMHGKHSTHAGAPAPEACALLATGKTTEAIVQEVTDRIKAAVAPKQEKPKTTPKPKAKKAPAKKKPATTKTKKPAKKAKASK